MHIAKVVLSDLLYKSHISTYECDNHSCFTCEYENYDQNELPCNVCYGIIPSVSKKCFWQPKNKK